MHRMASIAALKTSDTKSKSPLFFILLFPPPQSGFDDPPPPLGPPPPAVFPTLPPNAIIKPSMSLVRSCRLVSVSSL
ncbi:hypothetical protein BJX64DRAFT_266774, partial [Aspergillus heterothallicus]